MVVILMYVDKKIGPMEDVLVPTSFPTVGVSQCGLACFLKPSNGNMYLEPYVPVHMNKFKCVLMPCTCTYEAVLYVSTFTCTYVGVCTCAYLPLYKYIDICARRLMYLQMPGVLPDEEGEAVADDCVHQGEHLGQHGLGVHHGV